MTEGEVIVGARLAGTSVTKTAQLGDDVGMELQGKDMISKAQQ